MKIGKKIGNSLGTHSDIYTREYFYLVRRRMQTKKKITFITLQIYFRIFNTTLSVLYISTKYTLKDTFFPQSRYFF